MKERRFLKRKIELRATGDAIPHITGYAAVFNSMSEDLGGFFEVIEPAAFSMSLASADIGDCACLFNHDPNIVLGSVRSGTVLVSQDNVGLFYDCDPTPTQMVRDMVIAPIQRGDVDGSSFAFMVENTDWSETFKGLPVRRITSFSALYDVSPVTYPAYDATSATVRSLMGVPKTPEEVRQLMQAETKQEWLGLDIERARLEQRMRKFKLFNQ